MPLLAVFPLVLAIPCTLTLILCKDLELWECTEMPASALGNNTVVIGYTVYPEPASKNCAEGFVL